ncbi:MAG: hypothetical protein AAGI38_07105 [Bacteroidota bacterium]
MKNRTGINEGGVNGLGESLVNLNSKEFKALQDMIKADHMGQPDSEKMNNQIISLRFQMESYLSDEHIEEIIPAGNFIENLLKAANISKKKFAAYIEYDYSNLVTTLKGRRKINTDMAIKVGKSLELTPSFGYTLKPRMSY